MLAVSATFGPNDLQMEMFPITYGGDQIDSQISTITSIQWFDDVQTAYIFGEVNDKWKFFENTGLEFETQSSDTDLTKKSVFLAKMDLVYLNNLKAIAFAYKLSTSKKYERVSPHMMFIGQLELTDSNGANYDANHIALSFKRMDNTHIFTILDVHDSSSNILRDDLDTMVDTSTYGMFQVTSGFILKDIFFCSNHKTVVIHLEEQCTVEFCFHYFSTYDMSTKSIKQTNMFTMSSQSRELYALPIKFYFAAQAQNKMYTQVFALYDLDYSASSSYGNSNYQFRGRGFYFFSVDQVTFDDWTKERIFKYIATDAFHPQTEAGITLHFDEQLNKYFMAFFSQSNFNDNISNNYGHLAINFAFWDENDGSTFKIYTVSTPESSDQQRLIMDSFYNLDQSVTPKIFLLNKMVNDNKLQYDRFRVQDITASNIKVWWRKKTINIEFVQSFDHYKFIFNDQSRQNYIIQAGISQSSVYFSNVANQFNHLYGNNAKIAFINTYHFLNADFSSSEIRLDQDTNSLAYYADSSQSYCQYGGACNFDGNLANQWNVDSVDESSANYPWTSIPSSSNVANIHSILLNRTKLINFMKQSVNLNNHTIPVQCPIQSLETIDARFVDSNTIFNLSRDVYKDVNTHLEIDMSQFIISNSNNYCTNDLQLQITPWYNNSQDEQDNVFYVVQDESVQQYIDQNYPGGLQATDIVEVLNKTISKQNDGSSNIQYTLKIKQSNEVSNLKGQFSLNLTIIQQANDQISKFWKINASIFDSDVCIVNKLILKSSISLTSSITETQSNPYKYQYEVGVSQNFFLTFKADVEQEPDCSDFITVPQLLMTYTNNGLAISTNQRAPVIFQFNPFQNSIQLALPSDLIQANEWAGIYSFKVCYFIPGNMNSELVAFEFSLEILPILITEEESQKNEKSISMDIIMSYLQLFDECKAVNTIRLSLEPENEEVIQCVTQMPRNDLRNYDQGQLIVKIENHLQKQKLQFNLIKDDKSVEKTMYIVGIDESSVELQQLNQQFARQIYLFDDRTVGIKQLVRLNSQQIKKTVLGIKKSKLKLKIKKITELGQVKLQFLEESQKLNANSIKNIEADMIVALCTGDYNKIIIGTPNGNKNYKKVIENLYKDDKYLKREERSFEWSISVNHQNLDQIELTLIFDQPQIISRSDYGTDSLIIMFKSEFQIQPVTKYIPPQMDKITFEKGASFGQPVKSSVAQAVLIAILTQILLGGILSELFGLIQNLQAFNLIMMISIQYTDFVFVFLQYCIDASQYDMFNTQVWFEYAFKFRETNSYNTMFELFGIESMNFIQNAASLPVLFVLIIISWLFYSIVNQIAKKCYKLKRCRQIGLFADKRINLLNNLFTFYAQGYLDLLLSALLMLYVIQNDNGDRGIKPWFDTPSDAFSTVMTFQTLVAIFLFYFIFTCKFRDSYENQESLNLLEQSFNGIKFRRLKDRNKNDRGIYLFIISQYITKTIQVISLLYLDEYAQMQTRINQICFLLLACIKLHIHPFVKKQDELYNIFNDVCLNAVCSLQYILMLVSQIQEIEHQLKVLIGYSIALVIGCNFCVGIFFVVSSALLNLLKLIYQTYQKRPRQHMRKQKIDKRKKLLNELGPKLIPDQILLQNEIKQIKLCVQYVRERRWCLKNSLDVTILKEESTYQSLKSQKRYQICHQLAQKQAEILKRSDLEKARILINAKHKQSNERNDTLKEIFFGMTDVDDNSQSQLKSNKKLGYSLDKNIHKDKNLDKDRKKNPKLVQLKHKTNNISVKLGQNEIKPQSNDQNLTVIVEELESDDESIDIQSMEQQSDNQNVNDIDFQQDLQEKIKSNQDEQQQEEVDSVQEQKNQSNNDQVQIQEQIDDQKLQHDDNILASFEYLQQDLKEQGLVQINIKSLRSHFSNLQGMGEIKLLGLPFGGDIKSSEWGQSLKLSDQKFKQQSEQIINKIQQQDQEVLFDLKEQLAEIFSDNSQQDQQQSQENKQNN